MFALRPTLAALLISTAAAAAPPASASALRETVLAERSGPQARITSLDAGFGYVLWTEERGGPSTRRLAARFAVRGSGTTLRSGWRDFRTTAVLERGIGRGTDVPAVRIVRRAGNCRTADCVPYFLSPRTLRLTKRALEPLPADVDGVVHARDGLRTVQAVTVGGAGADATHSDFLPPSSCTVSSITGPAFTLPAVQDCVATRVVLRGSLVLLFAVRPSKTAWDRSSSTSTVLALDLRAPSPTWRNLQESTGGRGGATGVQGICLLDDGIAMLTGAVVDGDESASSSSWELSFTPVWGTRTAWSAAVRGLSPSSASPRGGKIACSGRSVYGLTTHRGRGGRAVSRVVRFTPPR